MAGIYKLEDVKEYFLETYMDTSDLNFIISDERIESCYKLIYAPYSRVNDEDKQWIAYSTEDYERETAIKAIKKILEHNSIDYVAETIIGQITIRVDEVGTIFEDNDLTLKPRIPFYVLVLHKLLP